MLEQEILNTINRIFIVANAYINNDLKQLEIITILLLIFWTRLGISGTNIFLRKLKNLSEIL